MKVNKSELVDAVVAVIRNLANDGILPRDLATAPIGEASTLESLALDSMGRMDLLAAVDEQLGIVAQQQEQLGMLLLVVF